MKKTTKDKEERLRKSYASLRNWNKRIVPEQRENQDSLTRPQTPSMCRSSPLSPHPWDHHEQAPQTELEPGNP